MANWDKDIHRIQEIQQLLEDRQRYFCGHLSTSSYKLDPDGNPVFYPKLHPVKKAPDSIVPSLGHSLEANVGSTDSGSNDPPLDSYQDGTEDKHEDDSAHSDSSEGNCADHSQDESSDATDVAGKNITRKKVKRKNPRVLRKWVAKNLEIASAQSVPTKFKAASIEDADSRRKSSILRFKAVSFDGGPNLGIHTEQKDLASEDFQYINPPRLLKKKKVPNPIKLLRRRSWILKAEMATRLHENSNDPNLNKVVSGLRKSSICHAREKLKKAEKSLRATVKNEYKIPAFKTQNVKPVAVPESKKEIPQILPKFQPLYTRKPGLSRLALRQQEEALRSDLNLREAFALIKINPDPLLTLASVDNNDSRPGKKAISSSVQDKPLEKEKPEGKSRRFALEDSNTARSLQRLTKLSIQHLQKQQSWVPNIVQPLQTQKGSKAMERTLKSMEGKNVKSQGKPDVPVVFDSSRRKSSVVSTSSVQRKTNPTSSRRPSMIAPGGRVLNLSSTGLKSTSHGVDRRESRVEGEKLRVYALDRLAGTVV